MANVSVVVIKCGCHRKVIYLTSFRLYSGAFIGIRCLPETITTSQQKQPIISILTTSAFRILDDRHIISVIIVY